MNSENKDGFVENNIEESGIKEGSIEENSAPETVDELIKEKEKYKFNASGNDADIQVFIQNAHFDGKADIKQIADLANVNTKQNRKYQLDKEEECTEFFDTCKNQEYIAFAIILSVFEFVSIGDLGNLKDALLEFLPPVSRTDDEGKEVSILQSNPYLSLNTILSIIGGKKFVTEDGQQCVGYGQGYKKVLNNMWLQFPSLRNPVIMWLLKMNDTFEYKTSFEAYQITTAFIRIITEDFLCAKQQVFEKLYSNPNNAGLLAGVAQELLRQENFKQDMLSVILRWSNSESVWLWKVILLVCLHKYTDDINNSLYCALEKTLTKRLLEFGYADLRFIVVLARESENVRSIMASVFSSLYELNGVRGQTKLVKIYLRMVRYGYYAVDKNLVNLPFVVCDSKEQISNISNILKCIMLHYDLRSRLFHILRAYLEEIGSYNVQQSTIKRLTSYFYVMSTADNDFSEDIVLFLNETKGKISFVVCDKLREILGKTGEKNE